MSSISETMPVNVCSFFTFVFLVVLFVLFYIVFCVLFFQSGNYSGEQSVPSLTQFLCLEPSCNNTAYENTFSYREIASEWCGCALKQNS